MIFIVSYIIIDQSLYYYLYYYGSYGLILFLSIMECCIWHKTRHGNFWYIDYYSQTNVIWIMILLFAISIYQ